jgi:4-hydroxy-tetrahydrodipicolinate synthase
MNFQGVYTALVTPFKNDQVDYAVLDKLLEMQLAGNVAGIVPVGTTGESPTLSTKEHLKVIEFVIEKVNSRCQIVAGTGANSTAEAVELTIEAKKMGADATLQVTPYYNKPTQEGLYRHFMTVAEKAELPIVLYNVPGRSGVAIAEDNVARMAKANPMIQAIKEAAGSVERVSKLLDICDIQVLSGDDALTLPMMSVGAKGIISVASNIIPAEMTQMVNLFLQGNVSEAMELHKKYYGLFRDQFIETNPIPIKAAMAMADLIEESYRLPLCEMSAGNREKLRNTLIKCGIIK